MRILLDVDGVLADFIASTARVLKELGGPDLSHDQVLTFEILGYIPEEFRDPIKAAWSQKGFCENLPLISGSVEGVEMLRELGEVLFVTSPMSSPYWHWERSQWLAKHLDSDGRDVIFASRKQHVVGDVLIDDRLDNLLAWQKAHPRGIPVLWSVPQYARITPPPGVVMIDNWRSLKDLLTGARFAEKR